MSTQPDAYILGSGAGYLSSIDLQRKEAHPLMTSDIVCAKHLTLSEMQQAAQRMRGLGLSIHVYEVTRHAGGFAIVKLEQVVYLSRPLIQPGEEVDSYQLWKLREARAKAELAELKLDEARAALKPSGKPKGDALPPPPPPPSCALPRMVP